MEHSMKNSNKNEIYISEKKIAKLAKKLSKTFSLNEEEALEVIYEEWDFVESLFHAYTKVKVVHAHLVDEINYTYRIA
jgi:hypothetical protein